MKSGVDEGPIVKALAYLLLLTVRDHDSDRVLETFAIALRTESNEPMSQEAIAFLIMPILDSLQTDLQLVCTSDCSRFFRDDSVKYWEGRDPLDSYWSRFGTRGIPPKAGKGAYHRLERTTEPCRVGFDMSGAASCPLYEVEPNMDSLAGFLATISQVIRARAPKPRTARRPAGSS